LSDKKKRKGDAPGATSGAASPGEGQAADTPAETSPLEPIGGGPMNVRLLEQIVRLMAANDLNTVDVRDGDKRVILKRGPAAPAITYAAPMHAPMAQPPASQPQAAASASSGLAAGPTADDAAGLVPIKAEMVGTFYSAPKPGEKPFVNVGSQVDEETEVCLIEAMKNYFAVKAGVSGSIARILVTDGQTVQFDQPLFLVRPN
jgi:acetyl-CoA carboxylase biotin carboxyl carrier protein